MTALALADPVHGIPTRPLRPARRLRSVVVAPHNVRTRPSSTPPCRPANLPPMVRTATAGGSDRVLLDRLRAGDEQALEAIFVQYGGYVFGLLRRVSGSTQAAEDLTQDVFTHLWLHPFDVDPERGSIRTFLGVVAHRRAVDWVRSETRRRARDERAGRHERSADDVSETVADRVAAAHVRAALDQLPETQRTAVLLAYFQGCSYREVARRLAIPEGTAKSRLRLALARLADLLETETFP